MDRESLTITYVTSEDRNKDIKKMCLSGWTVTKIWGMGTVKDPLRVTYVKD